MSDGPIVVVGAPRSGTTLLQLMLHAHPRIAIPPENRFVLAAYRRRVRFGDLRERDNRERLGRYLTREQLRFPDFGLPRRRTVRAVADGPPTIGSAIGLVLQEYAARFGSPRWGDKRPEYAQVLPTVHRLFPDMAVVHIVRDPRDAVASLLEMPWSTQGAEHAVARWAQAVDGVDRFAAAHPGSVVEVRYEDVVADPERELRRVCAALGEEFEPAMANPEQIAGDLVPERKSWHSRTRLAPTDATVGRWPERLEPWQAALCERALAAQMRSRGYEPAGGHAVGRRTWLRYRAVRLRRELRHRRDAGRDLLATRREPNPVLALLTAGQQAEARRLGLDLTGGRAGS